MRRRLARRCYLSTTATASPFSPRWPTIPALPGRPRTGRAPATYYGNKERIFARIAALRSQVDVIAVELQHEEVYNPGPIYRQVQEYRELRAAGADIVTGVQSHVPPGDGTVWIWL